MSVLGQHGGRRSGIIGPCRPADAPVTRTADECALVEHLVELLRIVLDVPTVTEEGERKVRRPNVLLRRLVLGGELQGRGVRAEHAGVGQNVFCGVHDVPMLPGALTNLTRRDEQKSVDALERGPQRVRLRVVGLADLHTAIGEIRRLLWAADRCDDLRGSRSPIEKIFYDEATKVSSRSSNGNHFNEEVPE